MPHDVLLLPAVRVHDGELRLGWSHDDRAWPDLTITTAVRCDDMAPALSRPWEPVGPMAARSRCDGIDVTLEWLVHEGGLLITITLANTSATDVNLQDMQASIAGVRTWIPAGSATALRVAYCGAHSRSQTSRSFVTPLGEADTLESWWVGAVSGREGPGLVIGGAKPERFVTRVTATCDGLTASFPLEGWALPPGHCVVLDPLWCGATPAAPHLALERFAAVLGAAQSARHGAAPSGWGSWGHWLERIDAGLMREMVHAIDGSDALRNVVQIVQIDDGWSELLESRRVSATWRPNGRFPSGLAPLATEIARTGRRCGLWILPFTVNAGSPIIDLHPDWLVQDGAGRPLRVGGGDAHCLDPTHPGAAAWLTSLLERFRDWGVDYVKLDFLRSLLVPDPSGAEDNFMTVRRYHGARTRLEAYRAGLRVIRDALGATTTIVACSAPAAAGVGLIDCHRVGPDIERAWLGHLAGVRDAARAVAANWFWHGRTWINDPDYLLTCESEPLTQFWATIVALSGGSVILSADTSTLAPWAEQMLSFVMPPIGRAARPIDLFSNGPEPRRWVLPLERGAERWTMLGVCNWGDRPLSERLPVSTLGLHGPVHVWDAWRRRHSIANDTLTIPVEPQSASLLRLTPVCDVPTLVGTDVHWAQGWLEFTSCTFDAQDGALRLSVPDTVPRPGRAWVWVPDDWVLRNGATVCANGLVVAEVRGGQETVINFDRLVHPHT